MFSLTSANAIFMLSIPPLYPTPIQIQGFAADNVFGTSPVPSAEISMGVDGKMSAGFVFAPIPMQVNLQADSASNQVFDDWYDAQQTILDGYYAAALMSLPAIGKKWAMTRGVLGEFPRFPPVGRILQPRQFTITWERVSPAPI